jgi:hypothetical protein
MKTFSVDVDITMSKTIEVLAENEEQAMSKVREMIDKNPYDYTNNFSHYVGYEIINADEED